jgi:protein phosphatase methylesterase 1
MPFFFCLHGAGMCALSFACAAKEIKSFARTLAFDYRGHGDNKHPDGEADLSVDTLVSDSLRMLGLMQKKFPESTFVLVGHSMGGAIAAKVSKALESDEHKEINSRVVGLIIIDVSEGTAIEALPHMEAIVSKKPSEFNSVTDAIRWT